MMSFIIGIIALVPLLYLLKIWLRGGFCKIRRDLTNQFIIVTGSSSGIGQTAAYDFLLNGAKVVYACRNEENAQKAINAIPEKYRSNASFVRLDLCSFKSIQTFANTIISTYPQIDILLNNAGAQPIDFKLTDDNQESFLQGNHLGPMYLTFLLLNHFNKEKARIINVSSMGHYFGELTEKSIEILDNPEKIKQFYFQSYFKRFELYCASKLMNIYFTKYLAEKLPLKYDYIKAVCLHPGAVYTGFFRWAYETPVLSNMMFIIDPILKCALKSPIEGAQTTLYLSYLPHEELCSGEYYADCFRNGTSARSHDINIRNAIINWSIKVIEQFNGPNLITL